MSSVPEAVSADMRVLKEITAAIERGAAEEAVEKMEAHPDLETTRLPFPTPSVDGSVLEPLIFAAVKQKNLGLIQALYENDDSFVDVTEEEEEEARKNGESFLSWTGAYKGFNPLHVAATLGYGSVVLVLLALGMNPQERTEKDRAKAIYRNYTALHLAAQNGHVHVFQGIMYFAKNEERVRKYVKERLREARRNLATKMDAAALFPLLPMHILRDEEESIDEEERQPMAEGEGAIITEEEPTTNHSPSAESLHSSSLSAESLRSSSLSAESLPLSSSLSASDQLFLDSPSSNHSSWFTQLLNMKNEDGDTALHVAAGRGRAFLVSWILGVALQTNLAFIPYFLEREVEEDEDSEEEEEEEEGNSEEEEEGKEEAQDLTNNNTIKKTHSSLTSSTLKMKHLSPMARYKYLKEAEQNGSPWLKARSVKVDSENKSGSSPVFLASVKAEDDLIRPFLSYHALLTKQSLLLLQEIAPVVSGSDSKMTHPFLSFSPIPAVNEADLMAILKRREEEEREKHTEETKEGQRGREERNTTSEEQIPSSFSSALPPLSLIDWNRREWINGDGIVQGVVQAGLQRVFAYNYPIQPHCLQSLYLVLSHYPMDVLHAPSYSFSIPRQKESENSASSEEKTKTKEEDDSTISSSSSPPSPSLSSSPIPFPSASDTLLDLNYDGEHPFDLLQEAQADWFEMIHAIAFWHSFLSRSASLSAPSPFNTLPALHESYPVVWQLLEACHEGQQSPLFAGLSLLLSHLHHHFSPSSSSSDVPFFSLSLPAPFSLPTASTVAELGRIVFLQVQTLRGALSAEAEGDGPPCKLIDTKSIPFTRKFADYHQKNPISQHLDSSSLPSPSSDPRPSPTPPPPPPPGHVDISTYPPGTTCPLGFGRKVNPSSPAHDSLPPSGHVDISQYPPGSVCPLGFGKNPSDTPPSTAVGASDLLPSPSSQPPPPPPHSDSDSPPSGHPDISKYPPGAVCPLGFGKKPAAPTSTSTTTSHSSPSSSASPTLPSPSSTDPPPPVGHPDISKYPPGAVCPLGFGRKQPSSPSPAASPPSQPSPASASDSSPPPPPSGHPDISQYPPGAVCPMGFGRKPTGSSSSSSPAEPTSPPHVPSAWSVDKILIFGAAGLLASLALYRYFLPQKPFSP